MRDAMRRKLSRTEIRKRQREGRWHDGSLPLSAKRVQRLKGEGRYHDALMPGLYLQISATGARSWLLRFELNGRERMMGLGSAAIFNLAQARERAREARRQLADGIDPLQARQAAKAAAKAAAAKALTFREAATRYAVQHEPEWHNDSHRAQFMASLKSYAFPTIGDMDVAAIDVPDVLRVIEPIWPTKTVTASRVRNRIEAVIDWCMIRGHRPRGDNPARWRGHLDQVLPKPRKVAKIVHHAAMPYSAVRAFMGELRERESIAARALEFTILCAARTNEVLGARWDEIDLNAGVWIVPASRMKAGKEHRVPLSPRAIALLHQLPTESGNEHVFIGMKPGAGLAGTVMARLMQRMGHGDVTVHGFRSAFSDWAHEQTAHANHTIELSLAHNVGSEVERAYRRKDMLAKRVRLMNDWARYCSSKPVVRAEGDGDVIVPIGGRR
jgi:integrase